MANGRYVPPDDPTAHQTGARTDGQASNIPFPARGQRSAQRTFQRLELNPEAVNQQPQVDDAHLEVLRQIEHAKAEAVEQGLSEGRDQAQLEVGGQLNNLQQALVSLTTLREELLAAHRVELSEIALAIAGAVIQREMSAPTVAFAQGVVDKTLEQIDTSEAIHLSLNPQDAEELEGWFEEVRKQGKNLKIAPDSKLQRGDIRARTQSGTLVSDLADRLAAAQALVLGSSADESGDQ